MHNDLNGLKLKEGLKKLHLAKIEQLLFLASEYLGEVTYSNEIKEENKIYFGFSFKGESI